MISAYFKDSLTWVRHQGKDEWGEPYPPYERTLKCRLDRKVRVVRDFSGAEVTSSGSILMKEKPTPDDLFVIEGRRHAVVAIHDRADFSTRYHEVYLA